MSKRRRFGSCTYSSPFGPRNPRGPSTEPGGSSCPSKPGMAPYGPHLKHRPESTLGQPPGLCSSTQKLTPCGECAKTSRVERLQPKLLVVSKGKSKEVHNLRPAPPFSPVSEGRRVLRRWRIAYLIFFKVKREVRKVPDLYFGVVAARWPACAWVAP